MTKGEFFQLTPRLFAKLFDRWREDERTRLRSERVLFALLRADVINYSFCRPKERVRPQDLLPVEVRAP